MDQRDVALAGAPPDPAEAAEHPVGSEAYYAAVGQEGVRQLTLGLVHEMNNVLGGIAVLSEIYQDRSGADDGLGEGLALIHKSTGRLQTFVGQLKILNGPAVGEPVYLNLADMARTMFEMFAPLLPKTLTVETAFPMEELAVHLDEARLRRVLLNLTLNLRDDLNRHPDSAGTLRVGLRHRSGSVELTLAASSRVSDLAPPSADARARFEDARRCLGEMGGTLFAVTSREFVLAIPLVV